MYNPKQRKNIQIFKSLRVTVMSKPKTPKKVSISDQIAQSQHPGKAEDNPFKFKEKKNPQNTERKLKYLYKSRQ